jgi:hypothetical protein
MVPEKMDGWLMKISKERIGDNHPPTILSHRVSPISIDSWMIWG